MTDVATPSDATPSDAGASRASSPRSDAPGPDTLPSDAPRSVWRQRAAWGAFAIFAAESFSFASWLPRLPELKVLFGLSEGALGFLLLALPVGALVVMPLAGWLSTRMGVGRLNLLCLGWMMGAITLIGTVPLAANAFGTDAAFWLLPPILFAVGLGSGAMGVAMNAAGVAVEGALDRPALSRCHAMFSLGLAGGGLLAGPFVAGGVPILAHLAAVNAVLLVVLLWAVRALPGGLGPVGRARDGRGDDGKGDDGADGAPRFAWPTGALLVPALVALGCLLAEGAALDWSPVYLATVLHADPALVGAGVTSFALAMAAVRFAGDWLSARIGDAALVGGGASVAALGYATVALAPSPAVAFTGFVLVGLGLAPIAPVAFRVGARSSPRAPGVGVAGVSTLGYAGFLLGPALVGLVAEVTSLRWSFGAIALVLAGVLALSVRLRSGTTREQEAGGA